MRTSISFSIPIAQNEYSFSNESVMRRSVEQYLQDLRLDVSSNESKKSKEGSLAVRRFQFLTMGSV